MFILVFNFFKCVVWISLVNFVCVEINWGFGIECVFFLFLESMVNFDSFILFVLELSFFFFVDVRVILNI